MTKVLGTIAGALVTLLVAVFGFRSCAGKHWERTLMGPYPGVAFTGEIPSSPSAVLGVPSLGRMEVYELQSLTNPVVVWRSPAGDLKWSRLLLPEKTGSNGELERAAVRELRLDRWEMRKDGPVVFVRCRWDWGGWEGGLIQLDPNHEFRSFSLSW